MTREQVQETMQSLPSIFQLDELVERLILIEQIEEGLADETAGRVITQEELERRVAAWRR